MANRKLVGELVELYWETVDATDYIAAMGNVGVKEKVEMDNLLLRMDGILTNVSKRWANGNRTRGYVPVSIIQTSKEDTTVQVTVNTL